MFVTSIIFDIVVYQDEPTIWTIRDGLKGCCLHYDGVLSL